jgi:hypothetical protein
MDNQLIHALVSPIKVLDTIVSDETQKRTKASFGSSVAKSTLCVLAINNDIIHSLVHLTGAAWEAIKLVGIALSLVAPKSRKNTSSTYKHIQLSKDYLTGAFSSLKGVLTPEKTLKHHAKLNLIESRFLEIELKNLLMQKDTTPEDVEQLLTADKYENITLNLRRCPNLTDQCLEIISRKFPNLKHIDISYTNISKEAHDAFIASKPNLESINTQGCDKIHPKMVEKIVEAVTPIAKRVAMRVIATLVQAVAVAILDKYSAPVVDAIESYMTPNANPQSFLDYATNSAPKP